MTDSKSPHFAPVGKWETLTDLSAAFPNAHIEEVGDRRELVIYTGWSACTYDRETEEWTDTPNLRLVEMDEFLD